MTPAAIAVMCSAKDAHGLANLLAPAANAFSPAAIAGAGLAKALSSIAKTFVSLIESNTGAKKETLKTTHGLYT